VSALVFALPYMYAREASDETSKQNNGEQADDATACGACVGDVSFLPCTEFLVPKRLERICEAARAPDRAGQHS